EEWRLGEGLVALDELSFGGFVELEGPAEQIVGLAGRLGLREEQAERSGYPTLSAQHEDGLDGTSVEGAVAHPALADPGLRGPPPQPLPCQPLGAAADLAIVLDLEQQARRAGQAPHGLEQRVPADLAVAGRPVPVDAAVGVLQVHVLEQLPGRAHPAV